jgi:urease subunit alpha
VAEEAGVQVAVHDDTLNEAGFVEQLMQTAGGRRFHAYRNEGAGGGHARTSPASRVSGTSCPRRPPRPFTLNTADEQLDMVLVAHHLKAKVPAERGFAERRVRASTMAGEDVLQDIGGISAMCLDAQAMGRIGEVSLRPLADRSCDE